MRYLLLLVALSAFLSCKTNMQRNSENPIYEDYKDVFILAKLIESDLRNSDGGIINLRQTVRGDSLNRISENFESLELGYRNSGYTYYFKFSETRNKNITLTDEEKQKIIRYRWVQKEQSNGHSGELQFQFPERGYAIQRIIVK